MFKCIIIDDEPLAIDLLKSYVEKTTFLELMATFTSPVQAFDFLEKHQIDLVFIDIQMPKLTGLQIIERIHKKSKFILTSAFREYAIDGFELDVLDFLAKPISYDRFLRSISKLLDTSLGNLKKESTHSRFIFIKENRRMTKIFLDEIIYLESQKDYLKIVTDTTKLTTRGTISYYEQWLPKSEFIRVHRSFIIAVAKITHYSEEEIELLDKSLIPIGELYSKTFREAVQRFLM